MCVDSIRRFSQAVLDGSQQPGATTGCLKDRFHQVAGRRFAVGPGDTDQLEAALRIAVKIPRSKCQRPSRIFDVNPEVGKVRGRGLVAHHSQGSLSQSFGEKVIPVGRDATECKEKTSPLDPARIVGEGANIEVRVKPTMKNRSPVKELPYFHSLLIFRKCPAGPV